MTYNLPSLWRLGSIRTLTAVTVIWGATLSIFAQTRPSVELSFAGNQPVLVISGDTGAVYSVQWSSDISSPSAWRSRTLFRAHNTKTVWTDPLTASTNQQFYRAAFVPAPADPNLVFIEPGTFVMGSPKTERDRAAEESPQTAVMLSRGFWIGKYSVTQAEYQRVMVSNPSYFTSDNGFAEDLTRPVEQVSWDDATNYCSILTQQDQSAGRIPTNLTYRLPTEAEYEYSYRAGTTSRFPYGDDLDYSVLPKYEWFAGNSGGTTHPVGQKLPNPWGLYDMGGNVANWCQDWHAPLPDGIVVDPQGPAEGVPDQSGPGSPPFHVSRVTAWDGATSSCRCAFRSFFDDGGGDSSLGIRVVLAQAQ